MITPKVVAWFTTLDVSVTLDVAVEVHVGDVDDFPVGDDTYWGILYGPGVVHIVGQPTNVDRYVRLQTLDHKDVSDTALPVQLTPLVTS